MEYMIFKNGFYLVGKSRDILQFLKQKARLYKTISEMLTMELKLVFQQKQSPRQPAVRKNSGSFS
ncbi:hypothetical protein [Biomaibacter acetigenes]|uniref:hypothetical protein n=1 Tax=Biomaibacter acetigenes TaxID=2316383 RepID=UPI0013CE7A43|nr:hypothetical protein [Biomaibacter acetigenes]